MQWFAENMIEALLFIGVVLLIIEIAVLGFSTFFLFFAGLGAVFTSILMWVGLIPESFLSALICLALSTATFALILWKPFSKMQNKVDSKRPISDLVGHTFVLPESITASSALEQQPIYQYSGIDWRLQAKHDLHKGTLVSVTQADVGALWVEEKVSE